MPDTNDAGKYIFRDENLINGLNYRYYIAAYNTGDLVNFIKPPVENSPVTNPGLPDDNTVSVTPRSPMESNLENIKVVPNPYISTNAFETNPSERELHFTHLPGNCTIRIYNVAGELMNEIKHDSNTSEAIWNLRTRGNQEVAPGLYFFHAESPNISGVKIGKFLVIK